MLFGDSEHDGHLTESVSSVQEWEEYLPALQSAERHDKGRLVDIKVVTGSWGNNSHVQQVDLSIIKTDWSRP